MILKFKPKATLQNIAGILIFFYVINQNSNHKLEILNLAQVEKENLVPFQHWLSELNLGRRITMSTSHYKYS